ncbi:tetratricopeptide repeat (TPR)-like superfamily protein [Tasmannia lanceolata]|uniref:tetratricopeptide repeat (TPR)-like superfamily protein n=1 Tax=Tasmannia lanceolata TaxID=3420 RepID=UPI00406377ED
MFGMSQQLDTSFLQSLDLMKAANLGVSVSLFNGAGFVKKLDEQNLFEKLNVGCKRDDGICRKSMNRRNDVHRPSSEHESLLVNLSHELKKDVGICGILENVKNRSVKCSPLDRNIVGKEKRKCLGKWVSYGGCIPSILQALDTVNDLDEALKPWEESLNNKERSIILKEQSNWERALEIFEWFKGKGCYELNVIHYNIMLRTLGKARKWDQVEKLWGEMESKRIMPTNSTYGTLIDVYSKGGLKEEALLWLDKMNKQGLQPDEVTMGIVVQTFKKAGEFEKAKKFFEKWSSGKLVNDERKVTPNNTLPQNCSSSYTYNTLIDMYGKSGQLKEASATFSQMLKEGIVPNTVTFNTMIHICGNHGHLEEVSALMLKMEELQCPPDTRTYNILISLYAKNDSIHRAAGYFANMKEVGLEPDFVSYRTLLYAFSIRHMVGEAEALVMEMDERGLEVDESTQSALTRMYLDAGLLETSWSWFMRFHLGGQMTSECYAANIDAFGEQGHLLVAEKAFHCCLSRQKLSVVEFNVMIKAYGIGKEYGKACELFDSMENHGISPDKCTYNSLIQILAGAKLPHRAKCFVRKMQEAGLVNDCIPYCAVISSFAKLGQLEMGEEVFQEMVGCDIRPDIIVFGVLINAFAEVGSTKKATNYVNAMKAAGFSGNSVIFNSLIKLYTKVGQLQEAEETYQLLQSSGVGPDVYSSNCMIDLYSERNMVGKAEEFFEGLKQRGEANEFSFAMMLCMYKKIGQFPQAIAIAHEMHDLGLLSDVLSFNNVIGLYASDGRLKEAAETFFQMINLGVQPDDSTFRSLGVILVKCGASKEAVGQLELAREKDAQQGIHAWIATLRSMMVVGNDELQPCDKVKFIFELDPDLENIPEYDLGFVNEPQKVFPSICRTEV